MTEFKYKRYDIVDFKITDEIHGIAEVVGVATNGVAVLGISYILRVIHTEGLISIPNNNYNYNCIVCPELWMTKRK